MLGIFVEMGNGPQTDVCLAYARTEREASEKWAELNVKWPGRLVFVHELPGRPCR